MKTAWIVVGAIALLAAGYFLFMQPAEREGNTETGSNMKIDIEEACESALAYMSFQSGAEAEAWVEACKRGEHPEAIEQYKEMVGIPGDSSAFRAEENMIVVMEQRPGSAITASQVQLASSGFVVIHEDINGEPGAIIGSSALLKTGESSQVKITLSRATRDGEKLHAMLHSDVDADGKFSASADSAVQSRLGGSIEGWFEISAEASESPAITI